MRIYAKGPRRFRQVVADVGMLAWALACLWAARLSYRSVNSMGNPSRRTASSLRGMIEQLDTLSRQLAKVPGVGDDMGLPLRALARALSDMAEQSTAQAASISDGALTLSILVFLIPLGIVGYLWLPRRLSFIQEASASQQFIDEEADLDLFALRAMANVPMQQLALVSSDPVGAWRQGDQDVIGRLAKLELDRVGLSMPRTPTDEVKR